MGVTLNEKEQSFVFDFEHDGIEDIVRLTGNGYQIDIRKMLLLGL